ncbi:hypothetical protein SODG_005239 [Sodalis praecaptivus]
MNLLYLTLVFPLAGFLLLAFSRGRWSENLAATVGVGSVGLSALTTVWVALDFFGARGDGAAVFTQTLWHWMAVGDFQIPITLSLDGLSLTMLSVVTGVGFLFISTPRGTCVGKRAIRAFLPTPICLSPACWCWCWRTTCC